MGRKFIYDQLVIASHNLGKIDEITELMAPLGITVRNSVEKPRTAVSLQSRL